ncbi:MAG TPA: hypothetical protein VGZ52_10645 [Acidimicrobiales bacterium]|nr:hypothetical protein [Acidimicrobiales bacterium]
MTYDPLQVGGVDDYPVKVGSMLLTLVDPHKGHERAYNRWYERDHYYGGCLIGPYCLGGSRWVAPRALKDLRWPQHDGPIATPWDAGSYVAIYFVERGHHGDFFGWGSKQVKALYGGGRGFNERTHVHTILYDHLGASYRDPDPVPIDLALDAAYDGIVLAWFDTSTARNGQDTYNALSSGPLTDLLAGTNVEIASSWLPSAGQDRPPGTPMDLGSGPGGPERLLQLFFVRGDVADALPAIHEYTDSIEANNLATVRLVAPFFRTKVGTDTYIDELW